MILAPGHLHKMKRKSAIEHKSQTDSSDESRTPSDIRLSPTKDDLENAVTEAMLQEEKNLKKVTEQEIQTLRQRVEKEFDVTVERQRYQRLKYLLDRTEVYSTFLADKLRRYPESGPERDVEKGKEGLPRCKGPNEGTLTKRRGSGDYITTKVCE
jgi:hypothetical protein